MSERTCSIDGCEVVVLARGWCSRHYGRWRKHGSPTAQIPPRRSWRRYAEDARCSIDGCEKPRWCREWCSTHYQRWQRLGDPSAIGPGRRTKKVRLDPRWDGVAEMCVGNECHRPVHVGGYCTRHYLLFLRFRLTPEAFAAILAEQGGLCPGCGESDVNPWHVDHDHGCCDGGRNTSTCGKCVRGILCPSCNRALGAVKDDPARLRALADYLERV